jgi:serine/threonine protein kinase
MGNVSWTAPEYLTYKRKNERNEKGDVFSFGVIVWELVTRQIPWRGADMTHEDIKDAVIDGERLEIPSSCPDVFKQVMIQCWKPSKF